MRIKTIVDEDFNNYRLPAMFIGTCYCDFKCCKEAKIPITVCQNEPLSKSPDIEIPADEIFRRYSQNPITSAIVVGGLEPILQIDEIIELIEYFRKYGCNDSFVIYTGYYADEIQDEISRLRQYPNIIMKFGRYKPKYRPHFDDVLGVKLISNNQYAEKIS